MPARLAPQSTDFKREQSLWKVMHDPPKGPRDCPQIPGKGRTRGTSRPRFPECLRPTRRLPGPRRPQETPGAQSARRSERSLTSVEPEGPQAPSRGARGQRYGCWSRAPARRAAPAPGDAPSPKKTQQNPEAPRPGTDFRANQANATPLPEEVASSRPARGLSEGGVPRVFCQERLGGRVLCFLRGRRDPTVRSEALQAGRPISRSPDVCRNKAPHGAMGPAANGCPMCRALHGKTLLKLMAAAPLLKCSN